MRLRKKQSGTRNTPRKTTEGGLCLRAEMPGFGHASGTQDPGRAESDVDTTQHLSLDTEGAFHRLGLLSTVISKCVREDPSKPDASTAGSISRRCSCHRHPPAPPLPRLTVVPFPSHGFESTDVSRCLAERRGKKIIY